MSMNIVNAKPLPPKIIFPSNVYTFNRARFAWEESIDYNLDPLSYNIQVSKEITFGSLMLNVMTDHLTYEMPFDLDYGIYYLRIRAYDTMDYGKFSKITSFGIKPQDIIPEVPVDEVETSEGGVIANIEQFDSDGDGVYDGIDKCKKTTLGSKVDSSGCACYQKDCDDYNPCTDDVCDETTAMCRRSFNSRPCGLFTDCPSDRCKLGNFYDYKDGLGICVNGMCFENSCIPEITYDSTTCEQPKGSVQEEYIIKEDKEDEFQGYDPIKEEFDEDKDGVPDYKDSCPNSKTKHVDKNGCECDQKRCVDLDAATVDLCYKGRCIFAPEDSDVYNQTLNLIEKDKKSKFNFNMPIVIMFILMGLYFLIVLFAPGKKKNEEENEER